MGLNLEGAFNMGSFSYLLIFNFLTDYIRAFVQAGISSLLPHRMPPELLSCPPPMALPLLLKSREKPNSKFYPYPDSKQFACEKCGRTYASTGNLKRHKKYECGVEPQFSCPVCKKKFQHRHSVKIHVFSTHRSESNEGGPSDPPRDSTGLFPTSEDVSLPDVGAVPYREEYFPLPQEAVASASQNQES